MTDKRQTLGIIPARKGSKRIPGKNTRPLAGKPLVQWSIEAAQGSTAVDELLVTSDDPAVLKLAAELGVDHIINRPAELASDTAASADALLHAIQVLKDRNVALPHDICLLQATSPLRRAEDIDGATRLYTESGATSVISVCELSHPLAWCAPLDANGRMTQFVDQVNTVKRSQDALPCYRLNGAIYLTRLALFVEHEGFLFEDTAAYVMPVERSVDIDHLIDFDFADFLIRCQR